MIQGSFYSARIPAHVLPFHTPANPVFHQVCGPELNHPARKPTPDSPRQAHTHPQSRPLFKITLTGIHAVQGGLKSVNKPLSVHFHQPLSCSRSPSTGSKLIRPNLPVPWVPVLRWRDSRFSLRGPRRNPGRPGFHPHRFQRQA